MEKGATIASLYEERIPLYEKYADVIIEADGYEVEDNVEAIIKAEKCRVNRIEDFDLNTKEEMLHELLTEDLKDYDK